MEREEKNTRKKTIQALLYIKNNLFTIISIFISFSALTISLLSYKLSYETAHPEAYYTIEYDLEKNFDSFSPFIERYLNDRSYNKFAFSLYLKAKNKNPTMVPRLDTFSGSFVITLWRVIQDKKNGSLRVAHISDTKEFLDKSPVRIRSGGQEIMRPVVKDLITGSLEYAELQDSWQSQRLNVEDVFDEMDRYGDLTLRTRYIGSYPQDYIPSPEEFLMRFNFRRTEELDLKRFVFIRFVGSFKFTDQFDNIKEKPLVLIFNGYMGDPYLRSNYNHALVLHNNNENLKAIEILERIVKRNPYYEEAYHLLGKACMDENQSKRAIDAFQKASELGHSDSNLFLTRHLIEKSDIEKAITHLSMYVTYRGEVRTDLSKENVDQLCSEILNNIYEMRDNLSKDRKNTLSEAFYSVGVIYEKNDAKEKAEEYLFKSKELSPSNLSTSYRLSLLLHENKKYNDAVKLFEDCIELSKGEDKIIVGSWSSTEIHWYYYYLGMSYRYLNLYRQAMDTFRDLINRNPEHFAGYLGRRGLVSVYEDLGDYDSAINYFNQALDIARKDKYKGVDISEIEEQIQKLKNLQSTQIKQE